MASGQSDADLDFASVQRDNPEMERRCQEVIDRCWQLGDANPILFIHDVGAGGLSNAMPELVSDGGRGGKFQLRDILSDEPGMSPLEIWCNESQERYVLAVAPEQLPLFDELCRRERAPYAVIGEATAEQHLSLSDSHFNDQPIDLPLDVLLGKTPKMTRDVQTLKAQGSALDRQPITLADAVNRVLHLPTVAEKNLPRHHRRPHRDRYGRPRPDGWPVADPGGQLRGDHRQPRQLLWRSDGRWASAPRSPCWTSRPLAVWRSVKR
ncbi:AIR synthase-related protein [Klebsiella pneumoniae]|nr:AIR synthase-related protein [Klebsiella pneumoniae]